jgi:hypothetical protein
VKLYLIFHISLLKKALINKDISEVIYNKIIIKEEEKKYKVKKILKFKFN